MDLGGVASPTVPIADFLHARRVRAASSLTVEVR
jgi:hypothetical protein